MGGQGSNMLAEIFKKDLEIRISEGRKFQAKETAFAKALEQE